MTSPLYRCCAQKKTLALLALSTPLLAPLPARAIVIGATNDFQDGTIQGWAGGTNRVNTAGGPAGSGDLYLRVNTTNTAGSGSHLAFHSGESDWLGNYAAAGVTAIEADVRNFGTPTINLRLVLFSFGTRWTSSTPIALAGNGAWTHVVFPINSGSMTRVLGSNTFADMYQGVDHIMFRHDAGTASSGGETITNGILGIDNIRAVPAPAGSALLGAAGLLAARRRR
jgi:hypothetical protein